MKPKHVPLTEVKLVLADYPNELRTIAARLRQKQTPQALERDAEKLERLAGSLDNRVADILARFSAGG